MIIRNAVLAEEIVDIQIKGEYIDRIAAPGKLPPGPRELDAGGRIVIPGMIDPHVHLRCPGMEYKEDWTSGGAAALSGGVTTVIDMPNTRPPTETLPALQLKRNAADKAAESCGRAPRRLFWVGCSPETVDGLSELLAEPDVAGVKLFFSESSVNASSSDIDFISRVFSIAAGAGKPVAVHSELAALLHPEGSGRDYGELAEHNYRRPAAAAVAGTALALEFAAVAGCRLYLCHLSTLAEFAMVRKHKQAYGRDSVIAELTPHHLLLDENHNVAGGPQSWAKVNPPLRTQADCDAAAEALLDGTIDCIGSDHAPHQPEEKNNSDFHGCPSGFPGLETGLGLIAGFLKGQTSLKDGDWVKAVSRLTNSRPAEIFGLTDRIGINAGKYADLVILDGPLTVEACSFNSKSRLSPFNGMKMPLSVYKTIAGGKIIEQ